MKDHKTRMRNLLSAGLLVITAAASAAAPSDDVELLEQWPQTLVAKAGAARFLGDAGDVAIVEYNGNYDRSLSSGDFNVAPRQMVAAEYLAHHPDRFDFLIVFSTFEFDSGDVTAFYAGIHNDVGGIGQPMFDRREQFSSQKLQGYIDMAALSRYDLDPLAPGYDFALNVALHEVMHRWGIAISFDDGSGTPNRSLIGRDDSHWSFFAHTQASVMYGADWQASGANSFTAARVSHGYGAMDLYLAGVLGADEVPPMFYIAGASGNREDLPPPVGTQISGVANTVTLDQIVAVEGPRVPDHARAQKRFRAGFVLLVAPGETASEAQLAQIQRFSREFQIRFGVETLGRATMLVGVPGADEGMVGLPESVAGSAAAQAMADLVAAADWLEQEQNAQGYWQDKPTTRVRDTALAVIALERLDLATAARLQGQVWLRSVVPANHDERAWLLWSGALAPAQQEQLAEALIAAELAAGGWGFDQGLGASPWDTALATLALQRAGRLDQTETALTYLQQAATGDPAWGVSSQGAGRIVSTALVLQSPLAQGFNSSLRGQALDWLRARQGPAGGFGEDGPSAHETARAVMALSAHQDGSDVIVLPAAVDALGALQGVAGDWDGSVYATASAVLALRDFQLPNVRLDQVSLAPVAPLSGEPLRFFFGATNDGVIDTPVLVLAVYAGDPDAGGVELAQTQVPALVAGRRFDGFIDVDSLGLSGSQRFYLRLDALAELNESSEGDNQLILEVGLLAAGAEPDLTLLPASLSFAPQQISRLPIMLDASIEVRNLSTQGVSSVDLALIQATAAGPLELARQTFDFAAGATLQVGLQGEVAQADPSQSFRLVVDPDDLIAERREDDNTVSFVIATGDAVDLAVPTEAVQVLTAAPRSGADIDVAFELRNLGTVDAPVTRFVARLEDPAGAFSPLTEFELQLAAGQTSPRQLRWRPSSAGVHRLHLAIDPDNVIAEGNEDNNLAVVPVTVASVDQANLAVDTASLAADPNPALAGQGSTLSAVVENTSAAAAGPFAVAFYDGDPTSTGVLLGTVNLPGLAGESSQVVELAAPPLAPGERLIYVLVDVDQAVLEFDEGDNLAFAPLRVLTLADLAVVAAGIELNPSTPIPGQPLETVVSVDNLGEQSVASALVSLYRIDAAGAIEAVAPALAVGPLAGGASAAATFSWTFPADADVRALRAVVDEANNVIESRQDNNLAEIELAQVDRSLFVSERHFSPNGDGVKDLTEIVFDLPQALAATIDISNQAGELIRRLEPAALTASGSGSVSWDGRNQRGVLARDGDYRVRIVDDSGAVVAQTTTVLDTNQLPLLDALGTPAALFTDLRCSIQSQPGRPKFSPDGRFLYTTQVDDSNGFTQQGLLRIATRGEGLSQVVASSWLQSTGLTVSDYWPLADGRILLDLVGGTAGGLYLQASTQSDPQALELAGIDFDQVLWVDTDSALFRGFDQGQTVYASVPLALGVPAVRLPVPAAVQDFVGPAAGGWLFEGFQEATYHGQSNFNSHLWYVAEDPGQAAVLLGQAPLLDWRVSADGRYLALSQQENNRFDLAPSQGEVIGWRIEQGQPVVYLEKTLDLPALWSFAVEVSPRNELLLILGHDGVLEVYDPAGVLSATIDLPPPALRLAKQSRGFDEDVFFGINALGAWRLDQQSRFPGGIGTYASDRRRVLINFGLAQAESPGIKAIGPFNFDVAELLIAVDLEQATTEVLASYTHLAGDFPRRREGAAPSRATWLPRSDTVLLGTNRIELLNTQNADVRELAIGPPIQAWPWRFNAVARKFYLRDYAGSDEFACAGSLSPQLVFESADNLIAHLELKRFAAVVELWGIASDRHPAHFQLDWTHADQPEQWRRLQAPQAGRIVDDFLTSWVPPTPGAFRIRLRVQDLAGNRAEHIRELIWAEQADLTGVALSTSHISPNGDGVKDQTSIEFRVLAPLDLDIEIHNAQGTVVRVLSGQFASAGVDAALIWDGRNHAGQVVADGEYFAHLQGRRLRVVVDTALPQLHLVAPLAYRSVFDERSRQKIVSTQFEIELQVSDAQLEGAQLELRRPGGAWQVLRSWQAAHSEPLRFLPSRDDYVEGEFRLSATDLAGNHSQLAVIRETPELILHSLRQFTPNPVTGLEGLDLVPMPFQALPFDPAQIPLREFSPNDTFHLLVDALAVPAVATVVLEFADPQQPDSWATLPKTPLPPEQVIPLLFSTEPAAEADSDYRHFLTVSGGDFGLLNEVLLRARIDLPGGSVSSNAVHLRFLSGDFDLRIGDFRRQRRVGLALEDRILFDALQAEPLVVSEQASLVWVRQIALPEIGLSRLTVQSPNDARYPGPTIFQPLAQVEDGQGNFAQLFAIPSDPCRHYRVAWSGTAVATDGQEQVLSLGSIDEEPALLLARSCIEVQADWEVVVGAFCAPQPSDRIQLHATAQGVEVVPTAMAFYVAAADGSLQLLRNIVAPLLDEQYNVLVDTSSLLEGSAEFVVEVTDSAGDVALARVLARIDRQAAQVVIDSPDEGQFQCANQDSVGAIGLDIAGAINSNDDMFYRAFIASGHEAVDLHEIHPQPLRPECEPVAGAIAGGCMDQPEVVGTLARYDSSRHAAIAPGPATVVVEAIDASGARQCVFRRFQLDASVDVQVGELFDPFSPNGDGRRDQARIAITPLERLSLRQVTVYPAALDPVFGWRRAGTAIGSLNPDTTPFDQAIDFIWDGSVGGVPLEHGAYQLEFVLRDDCGLERAWSSFGQLDLVAPEVALDYPRAGDPLGAIVEVLGRFDDALFEQATVAYFADGGWIDLARHDQPVRQSAVVAQWNLSSLAQAAYPLRIVASDRAGNETTVSETIDYSLATSLVWDLSAEPAVFSPNGDGSQDQTRIALGVLEPGRFTLQVVNSATAVVRTLTNDFPLDPGRFEYSWDGRADGGAPLADGDYTVVLTASDRSGSGFSQTETLALRLDTQAPSLQLIHPDRPVVAASGAAVIELFENGLSLALSHQAQGGAEQVLSASAQVGQQAVLDLSQLAEGAHSLHAQVRDRAGNTAIFEFPFTIDRTPPELTLEQPAGGVVGGAEGEIRFGGSVDDLHFEVLELLLRPTSTSSWREIARVEQAGAFEFTWPIDVADGDYELGARGLDSAGLESVVVVAVVIDRTAPLARLDAPLNGAIVGLGTEIRGSASDANLETYRLSVSPAQAQPPQWSDFAVSDVAVSDGLLWTWRQLPPDGNYRLRLQVSDLAGQSASVENAVVVDASPPEPPSGLQAARRPDGAITLDWQASPSADVQSYRVVRSGAVVADAIATLAFADAEVADGEYQYWVLAVDAAGNASGPSNVVAVTVDRTPPEVALLSPAATARVRGLVEVIGSASSADDFFEYRLFVRPEADASPGTLLQRSPAAVSGGLLSVWDTRDLAQEQGYILRLEGQDASGNVAAVERAVVVDNLAPQAPSGLSAQVLGDNDVQLDWSPNGESDLAGYVLYRDGKPLGGDEDLLALAIQAVSHLDAAVADGAHSYQVAAIDLAGNLSPLSAPATVVIETGPPTVVFVEPEAGARFEAPLFIQVASEATDIASVAFDFRPDGGAWTALSTATAAPYTTTLDAEASGLSFGAIELRATASDQLSQVDPAPPVISVTYADLTAPEAVSGLSVQVNGGQVDLSWTASNAPDLAGYVVERSDAEGNTVELNPTPIQTIAFSDLDLADGSYRYAVYAVDQVDNRSDASDAVDALVHALSLSQPFTPTRVRQLSLSGAAVVAGTLEVRLTDSAGSRDLPAVATAADGGFSLALELIEGINTLALQLLDVDGNRSKVATVHVQVGDAPAAPDNLAAVVNGNQVDLSWSAPPGEIQGYRTFRDSLPVAPDESLDSGTITATASSRPSTAGRTLDGSTFSAWSPTDSDLLQAPPPWIEYQFDQPRLLLGFGLNWRSFGIGVDRPSDYRLEAWSGLAWVELARVQGTDGRVHDEATFAQPYLTQRLRLVILEAPGGVGLTTFGLQHRPLLDLSSLSESRPDGRYSYQVSAVSLFGFESTLSVALEVEVGDVVAPDAPTLSGMAEGDTATLNWTASSAPDLAEYRLFRNGQAILLRSDLNDLSFSDTALANGRYDYFVLAVDAVGNLSPPSNTVILDIDLALPEPPTQLTVLAVAEGGALDLSWQASPSTAVNGYRIQRALNSSGSYQSVATVTDLSYRDEGLTNGTTYFYVVSAVDTRGNHSAPSNEASGTPADRIPPPAPVIDWPTTAAQPISLDGFVTAVGGQAEPGSRVEVFVNGAAQGQTTANAGFTTQSTPLSVELDDVALSPLTTQVATTGSPDHVLDLVGGERIDLPTIFARQLAWAPDGGAVYIVDGFGPTTVLRYHLASRLSENVLEWDDINLLLPSPNGQSLFVAGRYDDGGGAVSGLWWVDLATAAVHPIGAFDDTDIQEQSVAWAPDGSSVVFEMAPHFSSPGQLWHYHLVSDSLTLHSEDLSQFTALAFDGARVAYTDQGEALHLLDLASGDSLAVTTQSVRRVAFSADGEILAFTRGCCELVLYEVAGARDLAVYDIDFVRALNWLPTGGLLALQFDDFLQIDLPGRFFIDGLLLQPGENRIHALSRDAGGLLSPPSATVRVSAPAVGLPDLAVLPGDLSVIPGAGRPGDAFRASVVVRNIGDKAAASRVSLTLLPPQGEASTLLDQPFELSSGAAQVWQADLNELASLGEYQLLAQVDPLLEIQELDEANNQAITSFKIAAEAKPSLTLSTSVPEFAPGVEVTGEVTVFNPGDAFSGEVVVTVEDAAGFPLPGQQRFDVFDLGFAQSLNLPVSWAPGAAFAGDFVLRAQLLDSHGAVVDQSDAPFAIRGFAQFDLIALVDAEGSLVGQPVALSADLHYVAGNAPQQALVTWQIIDTDSQVVFGEQTALPTALPGYEARLQSSWPQAEVSGTYRLRVSLQSEHAQAASEALFNVAPQPQTPALSGSIALNNPHGLGLDLAVTLSLANSGSSDLNALPISLSLLPVGGASALRTADLTVDLAAAGQTEQTVVWSTADLALGNYIAVLRADLSGQGGASATLLDTAPVNLIDGSPPQLLLLAPVEGAIQGADVLVRALAVDPLSRVERVELSLDGGAPVTLGLSGANGEYQHWLFDLSTGAHSIVVRASDARGNQVELAPVTFEVDRTPPLLTIDGIADGERRNTPVAPAISVNDAHLASLQVHLDGQPFVSGEVIDGEGSHVLTAVAIDAAGNRSALEAAFVLDFTAPQIQIAFPANGADLPGPDTAVQGSTEALATVSLTAGGYQDQVQADASGAFAFAGVPLQAGANSLQLQALDLAGNLGAAATVTVNRIVPSVAGSLSVPATVGIGQPLAVAYTLANQNALDLSGVAFRVSLIETAAASAVAVVEGSIDLAGNASHSDSLDFATAALNLGAYRVELTADFGQGFALLAAANTSVVDQTAPVVAILAPAANAVTAAQADIRASAQDAHSAVAAVEFAIDAGPWAALTLVDPAAGEYAASASGLSHGLHQLRVRARDNAGNQALSLERAFEVDAQAPQISIGGVVDGAIYKQAQMPTFSAIDPHPGSLSATLNGAPFNSGDTVSAEGVYVLTVLAEDALGNQASLSVGFTIDTTAPQVAVTAPSDGQRLSQAVVAVVGQSEPNALITLTVNGLELSLRADTAGDFSFSDVALQPGDNTLSLQAEDLAGNIGPTLNLQVIYDTSALVDGSLDVAPGPINIGQSLVVSYQVSNLAATALPQVLARVEVIDTNGDVLRDVDERLHDLAVGGQVQVPLQFDTAGYSAGNHRIELSLLAPGAAQAVLADSANVLLEADEPDLALVILQPQNGETIAGETAVTVIGETAPDTSVRVVNRQFEALVVADAAGRFELAGVPVFPGRNTIQVTAFNDQDSVSRSIVLNGPALALWVNSQQGKDALKWSGSGSHIVGLVHSNAGIKISGSNKSVTGPLQWVSEFKSTGSNNVYTPGPVQVGVQAAPIAFDFSAYQPGGAAAVAAGTRYFDHSADCAADGKWQLSGSAVEVPTGLHYVPCEVKFSGSSTHGYFTVVSTDEIQVSGAGTQARPFIDNLLLATSRSGNKAIKLSGSGGRYSGYLYAPAGSVEVSGSGTVLSCGIVADRVKLSGSGHQFEGSGCAGFVLPDVSVNTAVDTAVPVSLVPSQGDTTGWFFAIVGPPQHGQLSGEGAVLQYQPQAGFSGVDQFQFVANDGETNANVVTVTIQVGSSANKRTVQAAPQASPYPSRLRWTLLTPQQPAAHASQEF